MEAGLSFTEFSYQLVQGFDYYWLYQHKNCKLQMGGSDQWGNILTGTELIRRKANGDAYALTTPLIKKADGTKFGKTEQGNIWLDRKKTSPYKFYQYWLNASDEDAINFIKIFTTKQKDEIDELIAEHRQAMHLRRLQSELAKEITTRVHSPADFEVVAKASAILFGNSVTEDLESLDEETLLSVLEGVPQSAISKSAFAALLNVTDLLSEATGGTIFPSKGEARKMIQGGGVSINKAKVSDPTARPAFKLLHGRFLLAQKGKRNYFLIEVKD